MGRDRIPSDDDSGLSRGCRCIRQRFGQHLRNRTEQSLERKIIVCGTQYHSSCCEARCKHVGYISLVLDSSDPTKELQPDSTEFIIITPDGPRFAQLGRGP